MPFDCIDCMEKPEAMEISGEPVLVFGFMLRGFAVYRRVCACPGNQFFHGSVFWGSQGHSMADPWINHDRVSYPDIKDVYYKGQLAYPTKLANGYLLDNRGISKNVVFLKYTYKEYSSLKETPSKETLLNIILDKNPIIEIYSCDKLSKNDIEGINKSISQGLPGICKKLNN